MKSLLRSLLFLVVLLCCFPFSNFAQKIDKVRVLVLGVDGLNTFDLPRAHTPNIDSLKKDAAWTYHAKVVMPSSSSPNWAAMTMGATPNLTAVHENGWKKHYYTDTPSCKTSLKYFPSIFTELRKQHPKVRIEVVHQWRGFAGLHHVRDWTRRRNTFMSSHRTMQVSRRYLTLHKPDLLFVHFDKVDHAGHKYGHGSPEYIAAVEEIDRYVGKMVQRLKKLGLYNSTYILLTADHGGINKGHGGATPQETNIPWILTGPNVKKNTELTTTVNTYDTALTLAKIFGIQPHECWVGKPVNEAFK